MLLHRNAPPAPETVGELTIVNGLVEATGPENLAAVGQRLLEDRSTHLGIVRGCLAETALRDVLHPAESDLYKYDEKDMYGHIPGLIALDKVVESWFNDQALGVGFVALHGARRLKTKSQSIIPHIDFIEIEHEQFLGPLSLSIRTDNNGGAPRIFRAKRYTQRPTVLADKIPEHAQQRANAFAKWSGQRPAKLPVMVEQHPGDIVLIPNHPRPSVHSTEMEAGKAAALILEYRFTKRSNET